jgi:hypothetical protein
VYTIETGLCLIAIILFVDETYYDRHIPLESQPPRGSRMMRMIGVSQWKSRNLRNTFGQAMSRPFIVLSKLPVAIASFYYLITFAWVVGINTTLAIFLTPLYNFGPRQIGKSPAHLILTRGIFYSTKSGWHIRLLLFYTNRCCHVRRVGWPLASRSGRALVYAPPQRPSGIGVTSRSHLAQHTVYAGWPRATWVRP